MTTLGFHGHNLSGSVCSPELRSTTSANSRRRRRVQADTDATAALLKAAGAAMPDPADRPPPGAGATGTPATAGACDRNACWHPRRLRYAMGVIFLSRLTIRISARTSSTALCPALQARLARSPNAVSAFGSSQLPSNREFHYVEAAGSHARLGMAAPGACSV